MSTLHEAVAAGRTALGGNGAAASDLLMFPRTDTGNAERFAALFGDRVRFDHRQGRWLLWAKQWWQADADAAIRRLAKEAARNRYQDATAITDLDEREREAKWAITSESRVRLDAALSLAQAERPIADAGDQWDTDAWLLGVANGVVELRTGELRPGRQADRITMHTSITFDPSAECPRWLQFVEEIFAGDADLIGFVQRAAGYSLTGDASGQCLFICYGGGENGKSTLLALLREVLGDYAYNMPFNTIELRGRQEQTFDLADLAGRRLVTASETNESARLNEARVKALTGEDPITARRPYGQFETFTPTLKLWLGVNHKPRVDDDSHAFWRRVRLIPFTQRFDGDRRDPNLKDKLRAELPGILAWAVRGCLEWQEHGLEPPAQVRAATEQYREDSDVLATFLAERCVMADDLSIGARLLYQAYRQWAGAEGIREREQLSSTAFGRRMAERFECRHSRAGRIYLGVAIREGGQRAFSGEPDKTIDKAATDEDAEVTGLEGPFESEVTGLGGDPRLFHTSPHVEESQNSDQTRHTRHRTPSKEACDHWPAQEIRELWSEAEKAGADTAVCTCCGAPFPPPLSDDGCDVCKDGAPHKTNTGLRLAVRRGARKLEGGLST